MQNATKLGRPYGKGCEKMYEIKLKDLLKCFLRSRGIPKTIIVCSDAELIHFSRYLPYQQTLNMEDAIVDNSEFTNRETLTIHFKE